MCGIAGANLNPKDVAIDSLELARALLCQIESRGRDASGAAWHEGGEDIWYDKAALPGRTYAGRLPMSPNSGNFILHTRFATQGDPDDNRNNHPHLAVSADDCIIGVHNGVLRNDRALWKALSPKGVTPASDCDSEVIFALLAHSGRKVRETLPLIDGDAAIAWIRRSRPERLHLATTEGRPLAVGTTRGGSTIFASTAALLKAACFKAAVPLADVWEVPEWTHIIVEGGEITFVDTLPLPTPKPAKRPVKPVSRPAKVPASPRWEKPLWEGGRASTTPQNRRQPVVSRSAPVRFRQTPLWEMSPVPLDELPDRYGLTPAAVASLRLGADLDEDGWF